MRQINFRAWDDHKKEMVYCDNNHYWAFFNSPDSIGYGLYHRKDGRRVLSGEYNPPIMKFTGKEDKNGKEIYEGDIVTARFSFPDADFNEVLGEPEIGVVYWDTDFGCWSIGVDTSLYTAKEVEVIGNIHTHPHLLNRITEG